MLGGYVVYELLDKDCFADARAAEKSYLAAFAVRLQQIYRLYARFEYLDRRALLAERRRGAVDAHAFGGILYLRAAVDGRAEYVEHSAQRPLADGHLYALSGCFNAHAAREPFAFGQHDAAHRMLAQMLRNFHYLVPALPALDDERVAEPGDVLLEHDVHDGTRHSGDYSVFH